MKIEKVRLDKYEGPDDEYITLGKIYEVMRNIEEEDGEYVIFDDLGADHVVLPEWCTITEDEFGIRDTIKKYSEEWSGEGLPPVGSYVEYSGKDWEVCGINNGEIWLRTLDEFKMNVVFNIGSSVFKPIKSQKQKEIEELEQEIINWCVQNMHTMFDSERKNLSKSLYEAGYRKTK